MHQTIYIDIDEEITSIVEKLKKSQANEVIIVVPKRALLIQSIVNLRLLKKEADALGVQLMIVTQDKLGKLLVEKAGILVQQKLDDLEDEEVALPSSPNKEKAIELNSSDIQPENNRVGGMASKNRLDNLGSENYFDELRNVKSRPKSISRKKEKNENENILNKELVTGVVEEVKKSRKAAAIDLAPPSRQKMEFPETPKEVPTWNAGSNLSSRNISDFRPKEEIRNVPSQALESNKIENFFNNNSGYSRSANTEYPKRNDNIIQESGGKAKKVILVLFVAAVVVASFAGAFLFLPKATVAITAKSKSAADDFEVKADVNFTSPDFAKETIPAKLITQEDEITQTFPVSGTKAASSQKARGTISIYNEFSSTPQQLVATTRFQTEDGKIFRITSGVTVPGTTKVGTETKPGVIEAEVTADQPGSEYNIGPAKFSIPGFKDNAEKSQKFYAVSSKEMTGGGSASASGSTGVKTLADSDISNAKSKLLPVLTEDIKKKIKESAGDSVVILDDAINLEDATYKNSGSVGDAMDSFTLTANVKASAVVFQESDLKSIINSKISKTQDTKVKLDGSSIALEYGKSSADFKLGTLNIKVHAKSNMSSDIDIEELKKNIAGKNNNDLEAYLSNFPDIEKVEVTYWPPFMSNSIPRYEKRIDVVIQPPQ